MPTICESSFQMTPVKESRTRHNLSRSGLLIAWTMRFGSVFGLGRRNQRRTRTGPRIRDGGAYRCASDATMSRHAFRFRFALVMIGLPRTTNARMEPCGIGTPRTRKRMISVMVLIPTAFYSNNSRRRDEHFPHGDSWNSNRERRQRDKPSWRILRLRKVCSPFRLRVAVGVDDGAHRKTVSERRLRCRDVPPDALADRVGVAGIDAQRFPPPDGPLQFILGPSFHGHLRPPGMRRGGPSAMISLPTTPPTTPPTLPPTAPPPLPPTLPTAPPSSPPSSPPHQSCHARTPSRP